MNLADQLNLHEHLVETCRCGIGVGDEVVVDGRKTTGVVIRRNGRKLTIELLSGERFDKDQSFVHKVAGRLKDET